MDDAQKLAFIIERLAESSKKYEESNFSDSLKGFFLHSEVSAILTLVENWEG